MNITSIPYNEDRGDLVNKKMDLFNSVHLSSLSISSTPSIWSNLSTIFLVRKNGQSAIQDWAWTTARRCSPQLVEDDFVAVQILKGYFVAVARNDKPGLFRIEKRVYR